MRSRLDRARVGKQGVAIAAAAFVALAASLVATVFVVLPDWFAPERSPGFGKSLEARARHDVRTTTLQLLGGLVLAAGAIYTARTYELNRKNALHAQEVDDANHKLDVAGQITERFASAMGLLGHEKVDVRLGGIYALERVAFDSEYDHPQVVEVLTAYVREHARSVQRVNAPTRPRTDVQAAVSVLGRRKTEYDRGTGSLDLHGVDLRGVQLRGASLHGVNLNHARLDGADAIGADLTDAWLAGAQLRAAHLDSARLERARLMSADMTSADLRGAHLGDAWMNDATMTQARLVGAHMTGAHLDGADLAEAHLVDTELQGAWLTGANLQRAELEGADLKAAHLAEARLEGANLAYAENLDAAFLSVMPDRGSAHYDASTQWPEGFDAKRAGARPNDAS